MTDPYTPTTEEVRCAWCDEIARGYASVEPGFPIANLSCGEHGSDFTPGGDLFKSWLAAHDAQVREEGAKAMREAAAVASQNASLTHDITPAGPFTAQQRAADEARTQIAAAIRALPIPSTGTERELVKDNGDDGAIDRLLAKHGHAPLAELRARPAPVDRLAVIREVIDWYASRSSAWTVMDALDHFGMTPSGEPK